MMWLESQSGNEILGRIPERNFFSVNYANFLSGLHQKSDRDDAGLGLRIEWTALDMVAKRHEFGSQ
jgi:hypothetical protein